MEIDGVAIGSDEPAYFIAEAGVNHNGDLEVAKNLIDVALEAKADAVKFQTFSADRLVTRDASKAQYQKETTDEEGQYDMLKRYELNRDAHEELISYCADRDITFLSTPFDRESASMLSDLGVPAIKIGSGELDNHPLLEHVAELGKPLIVSTGMGTMEEVRAANDVITGAKPDIDVAYLHCTSAYPASLDDVHLRAMGPMATELDEPVGYSDHTTLPETPAFAVAAGACIVEKHFTLDSSLPGPDHEASLEPDKLRRAVELSKQAARARGTADKRPTQTELENIDTIRKGLYAAEDLPAGTRLTEKYVDVKRPAVGLSPRQYWSVIGTRTTSDLESGDPILPDSLDGDFEDTGA